MNFVAATFYVKNYNMYDKSTLNNVIYYFIFEYLLACIECLYVGPPKRGPSQVINKFSDNRL